MIILWSEHDGRSDTDGNGVVRYMTEEEWLKQMPDGVWKMVIRDPPPIVLRGDPALVRQAIQASPFERKYASGVFSFEQNDIDISAFHRGDLETLRRISEVIAEAEETAFAGIPPEFRPPTLWTTHTHTGRLELNFCAPRALLAGTGRIRSINPHPPGEASRALWDAFRDTFNFRYGWADPEDPARARTVKVPDYIQKTAAEALRAGYEVRRDPREVIADWAVQRIHVGLINCRTDLIHQLEEAGLAVPRQGRDYITIKSEDGTRLRLKGPIFSETFKSCKSLGAAIGSGEAGNQQGPRGSLAEAEERLTRHRAARARFNLARYGGPHWKGKAFIRRDTDDVQASLDDPVVHLGDTIGTDLPDPSLAGAVVDFSDPKPFGRARKASSTPPPPDKHQRTTRNLHPDNAGHRNAIPESDWDLDEGGSIAPVAGTAYKNRLWFVLYGVVLNSDLLMSVSWIDTASRTVRLRDGSEVQDHGNRISATMATQPAIHLMIAEALAKGWHQVTLTGSDEFKQRAAQEAVRNGLHVTNPELQSFLQTQDHNHEFDRNGTGISGNRQGYGTSPPGTRRTSDSQARQLDAASHRFIDESRKLSPSLRAVVDTLERGCLMIGREREREHDQLKREVDLRELARQLGFAEDRKASDQRHFVLRHPDGSKLIVGLNDKSGHWVFSSNCGRCGTAIDLLQWREGLTLSDCRKRLRSFIGAFPESSPVSSWKPKAKIDLRHIRLEWETAKKVEHLPFLEKSRGLDPTTIACERFRDTFRTDTHHNAVFPYRNASMDIIALERRNRPAKDSEKSFKSYSSGGQPGVWISNMTPADKRLVIVESPIDAMAHYEMSPPEERSITRYAAIRNGTPDSFIRSFIEQMPLGSIIVGAADNDEAGRLYNSLVKRLTSPAYQFEEAVPGRDWNADLMLAKQTARQTQPSTQRNLRR